VLDEQAATALGRDYRPPFLRYLAHRDEAGLRSAYELGRQAITRNVGLLALVRIHNDVFLEVLATANTLDAADDIARAASCFLVEALAAFEMTHRAFPTRRRGADR
jgi:hypothetical protein